MEENKKEEKVDLSQLRDLDFAPNWNNNYKKYEQSKDQSRPKHQSQQREFKRKKKELPEKYDTSFTDKFKITVNADQKILDALKKAIIKSSASYSLEEINNAILDKKNSLQITIENLGEKESFYITRFDDSIFRTKSSAINHIVENGLKHVVDINEKIGENPNGKFKSILRCSHTKLLLPPKSFHDFEVIIKTHLMNNNIKMNYEKFVNQLEIIEDEKEINEWKNKPLKKIIYITKTKDNKRSFDKIETLKSFLSSAGSDNLIKTKKIVKVKGSNIDRFENNLSGLVINFLKTSYQWKKDLFFSILINLKKSGFCIFKYGPNNYLFAVSTKPKKIDLENLSENCVKIVKYIQLENPVTILKILSQYEEMKLQKNQILIELKWLIKEGYLREFSDGTITC